jgi:hypothetical protein
VLFNKSPSIALLSPRVSMQLHSSTCPARAGPVKTQGQISCSTRPKPQLVIWRPVLIRRPPQSGDNWRPNKPLGLPNQSPQHLRKEAWIKARAGEFYNHGHHCSREGAKDGLNDASKVATSIHSNSSHRTLKALRSKSALSSVSMQHDTSLIT